MPMMKIKTAGLGETIHGDETMIFWPGPSLCGPIKDGVSFDVGHGGWVIDYEDFIRMAEAAKAARAAKEKA